jgi:hypothetical protein
MKTFQKFEQFQIGKSALISIKGGVTRQEYCATNAMIMRSCFNSGDTTCLTNAGAAWEANCQPYGL